MYFLGYGGFCPLYFFISISSVVFAPMLQFIFVSVNKVQKNKHHLNNFELNALKLLHFVQYSEIAH